MRRTNVMVEVEDDVYSVIVEPHKRNKTFSKLISSLLNGYITDGYIRAFVDDNLEEVRKAVVGSFADSVGEMESVLANMGLFTDELEAHANVGYAKFQQKRSQQAEELDKGSIPAREESPKRSPDVDALNDKVNDLERNVTEGFNRIIELLNGMSSNSVSYKEPAYAGGMRGRADNIISGSVMGIRAPEPVMSASRPEPVRSSSPVAVLERPVAPVPSVQVGGYIEEYNDPEVGVEEESSVTPGVASNFLSSLMSDFGVGF